MNYIFFMHIIQNIKKLFCNLFHFAFCECSRCWLASLNYKIIEFTISYELGDNEIKFIILEKFVYSHYIGMGCIFKDFKFISHKILQNLMTVYLLLPYDLDGTFYFSLPMHSYPYLSKASFSEHPSYFVPIFNILHIF